MNLLQKGLLFIHRRLSFVDGLEEEWKKTQCTAGRDVHFHSSSKVENLLRDRSAIKIGSHVHIRGQLLVMAHGGEIRIGDFSYIGEDTRIWSSKSVTIGDRVLVSHGVNIHDNIAHSLSAKNRHEQIRQLFSTGHPSVLEDVPAAPIMIEDDVWIGFNSTILKGVTIGKGAVVGAATVVTKNVDPYAIVVGNPARIIGQARP